MITLSTPVARANIVTSVSDLPRLAGAADLYMDVETTAFDDEIEAFHPYMGHRICGIAITADDYPEGWYIPLRHLTSTGRNWNLPIQPTLEWLQDILRQAKRWTNHNVKFDARFFDAEGLHYDHLELIDSLVFAKLIDSDRVTHALKPLCREWCGLPMEEAQRVEKYLKGIKSKDYAAVPADILGEYAVMDVIGVRALIRQVLSKREDDMGVVWSQEQAFTPVLLDMERDGLSVDVQQTRQQAITTIEQILADEAKVKKMTGVELKDSSDCFYEILCTQLGLPVLKVTEETEKGGGGNPSFDKETLLLYAALPEVVTDDRANEVVQTLQRYKIDKTYKGLFLDTLLDMRDTKDRVHPVYNQLVRTGRMSCSEPNSQQFNVKAKHLIIPEPGDAFLCMDASQVEFRVITHYCKNAEAIKAYNENPDTDYHQWVADLIGVGRKPAKTINFAMAYGAGRKRITMQLGNEKDIVDQVAEQVAQMHVSPSQRAGTYKMLLGDRAEYVYQTYHAKIPELRSTAEQARGICVRRGYIRDLYGKRRHLPEKMAHKAFNSLVQGCAMNLIKERMIAVSPRYNQRIRDLGIRLRANVHDELLFSGPRDVITDERIIGEIRTILENVTMQFRVPFRWDGGTSNRDWAEAKGK